MRPFCAAPVLLVLASFAGAQGPSFEPEGIFLLPEIDGARKHELHAAVRPTFEAMHREAQRHPALDRAVRAAKDAGARRRAERERQAWNDRIGALARQAESVLRKMGLRTEHLEFLRDLPRGPLREERFMHRLAREVPGLTARQRVVLERCAASADAAQATLRATRIRLEERARTQGHAPDSREIRSLATDYEQERGQIERRFWIVCNYVLTIGQRQYVRKRLPLRHWMPPDMRGHIYMLPGLTPSQVGKIDALYSEWEAESAADSHAVQALNEKLADTSLGERARDAVQKERAAAQERLQKLLADTMLRGRTLFTQEQQALLDALPPLLGPDDRSRHPGEYVMRMKPRPRQMERLHRLGAEIDRKHREVQENQRRKLAKLRDYGSDSPQAMMTQMAQRGARAEVQQVMERAAREALLQVLEPDQIAIWIASGGR